MISVIMATNKIDGYIRMAISSILSQTLKELELLIIANGKFRFDIEAQIRSWYPSEPRIRIVKTQIEQLAYALNLGIDNAKYEYIARMDADDISLPNRLELQLNYLRTKDLDIVGSNAKLIDENEEIIGERRVPSPQSQISKSLPYRNAFIHPTILARKDVLLAAKGYNSGLQSEDYDLWLRLKKRNIKWENMQDTLLKYRIHRESSQRRLLPYAECAGLAAREFFLHKTLTNMLAMMNHFGKAMLRKKFR